ncbi:hypothetical protein C2L89_00615 [Coxiella burnetii]|nr:hypothetical protein C2L89_00615 [Coxiella burnetii]
MSLYTCEAQQKVRKQCESQSPTQMFIVRLLKVFFLPTGLLNLIRMMIVWKNEICWASQAPTVYS